MWSYKVLSLFVFSICNGLHPSPVQVQLKYLLILPLLALLDEQFHTHIYTLVCVCYLMGRFLFLPIVLGNSHISRAHLQPF